MSPSFNNDSAKNTVLHAQQSNTRTFRILRLRYMRDVCVRSVVLRLVFEHALGSIARGLEVLLRDCFLCFLQLVLHEGRHVISKLFIEIQEVTER